MANKTFTVEGMSCNHCKNAVEKAVSDLLGVRAAEVNLAAKMLKVEYDEAKASEALIKKAVDEAGYKAL